MECLLFVKARAGVKVPKEGNPRRYIVEGTPIEVPSTPYYRRQLADGDLVEVKRGTTP